MPFIFQLTQLNFQLLAEQIKGVLGASTQNIIHAHELGSVFVNHTSQRRNTHLTIGEGIQGIDGQIRTDSRRQLHFNFHVFGGIVDDLFYFDFAIVARFDDALNQRSGGGSKGNFFDEQRRFVFLLDF